LLSDFITSQGKIKKPAKTGYSSGLEGCERQRKQEKLRNHSFWGKLIGP
jgi:hypothetical protein